MADANDYEEARKRRVRDNLKRFEDLGIYTISKSLLEVANGESRLLSHDTSYKPKKNLATSELRRSSRPRNVVSSFSDDKANDLYLRSYRKRCSRRSYTAVRAGRSYTAVRAASYEEHKRAVVKAEKIQRNLKSGNPSFIKSMVRSHVSSCFWLGLPSEFCQNHLPPNELKMVLEDENGSECEAVYIGKRTGLSGGWRGFSIDHKLDDGDVLVFELCQPSKFKVYIVKAIGQSNQDSDDGTSDPGRTTDQSVTEKPQLRTGSSRRAKRPPKRSELI